MASTFRELADWAVAFAPTESDLRLARTALTDTLAVTLAAEHEPIVEHTAGLPAALRWTAIGHTLDFDDVHLPSTSHISVVCASATLTVGGGDREFLAAAGVMARLGTALGWGHYQRGWHATCTAGAPAAAVAAALGLGLGAEGVLRAMALAVPAAGGLQRAFGTEAKPLQVGFATDAGVRAARLAAAGASADPAALDHWFDLVGASTGSTSPGPRCRTGSRSSRSRAATPCSARSGPRDCSARSRSTRSLRWRCWSRSPPCSRWYTTARALARRANSRCPTPSLRPWSTGSPRQRASLTRPSPGRRSSSSSIAPPYARGRRVRCARGGHHD
nr:MmgE/PrpD family protein [Streptomyces rapamycinicus]